jgi:hypothetical protein
VPFIEEDNKIGQSLSVENNRTAIKIAAHDARRPLDT